MNDLIRPAFYTPAEVAKILNISLRQVYFMVHSEELPSRRFGRGKRSIRIPRIPFEQQFGIDTTPVGV